RTISESEREFRNMAQVAIGLVTGAFYAMLSLGLAVIFGMLNVINFTHGAQFMMGAFAAWLLLGHLEVPFWAALVLSPLIVGLFGVLIERLLLKRIYHLDHLYGFLLTFGLALIIEGLFQWRLGFSRHSPSRRLRSRPPPCVSMLPALTP